mmetsp:Transcript_14652/g.59637  ORF Transcript_14652/g.59637 Transcript_14652/m.59637 type:complete len:239 (+) Transcript_14652:1479-2195(+)
MVMSSWIATIVSSRNLARNARRKGARDSACSTGPNGSPCCTPVAARRVKRVVSAWFCAREDRQPQSVGGSLSPLPYPSRYTGASSGKCLSTSCLARRRSMRLNAFPRSSRRTTESGTHDKYAWIACSERSHPPLTPIPSCKGTRSSRTLPITARSVHCVATFRKTSGTPIGRTPGGSCSRRFLRRSSRTWLSERQESTAAKGASQSRRKFLRSRRELAQYTDQGHLRLLSSTLEVFRS